MACCLRHQAIAWTNVDLYSVRYFGDNLRTIAKEMLKIYIPGLNSKNSNSRLQLHLSGPNELSLTVAYGRHQEVSNLEEVERAGYVEVVPCLGIASHTLHFRQSVPRAHTHRQDRHAAVTETPVEHTIYDDVMTWTHFQHYWSFVQGIRRLPPKSQHREPIIQSLDDFCCCEPKLLNKQSSESWKAPETSESLGAVCQEISVNQLISGIPVLHYAIEIINDWIDCRVKVT